jgi:hypothetical protein
LLLVDALNDLLSSDSFVVSSDDFLLAHPPLLRHLRWGFLASKQLPLFSPISPLNDSSQNRFGVLFPID